MFAIYSVSRFLFRIEDFLNFFRRCSFFFWFYKLENEKLIQRFGHFQAENGKRIEQMNK